MHASSITFNNPARPGARTSSSSAPSDVQRFQHGRQCHHHHAGRNPSRKHNLQRHQFRRHANITVVASGRSAPACNSSAPARPATPPSPTIPTARFSGERRHPAFRTLGGTDTANAGTAQITNNQSAPRVPRPNIGDERDDHQQQRRQHQLPGSKHGRATPPSSTTTAARRLSAFPSSAPIPRPPATRTSPTMPAAPPKFTAATRPAARRSPTTAAASCNSAIPESEVRPPPPATRRSPIAARRASTR